ncbi:hypothetical protein, partial [Pseudomonas profundi]|uniref:hypothetical protein n=1 Tax=Pseudomonas profundi TaxID=1981513 RepID=UPI001CC2262C
DVRNKYNRIPGHDRSTAFWRRSSAITSGRIRADPMQACYFTVRVKISSVLDSIGKLVGFERAHQVDGADLMGLS